MLKTQCFLQAMQILKRPTLAPAAPSGQSTQSLGDLPLPCSLEAGRSKDDSCK